MTQFNSPPPPVPPRGPGGVVAFSPPIPALPSTSGLAIASLVCALIFCFPFLAPALAILLGIIALVSISRSAGRKKGAGLATAGIVVGSLVLLAHVGVVVMFVGVVRPVLNSFVGNFETFTLNVEGGHIGEARNLLTADAQKKADRQSLRELAALLQKDYGAFKSVSFDLSMQVYKLGVTPPAGGGNPYALATRTSGGASALAGTGGIPLPIKVEFSQAGTVYGQLVLDTHASASASGGQAVANATPFGIDSFTLVGPNGPWTFPFPPASNAPPTSAPKSETDSGADTDDGK